MPLNDVPAIPLPIGSPVPQAIPEMSCLRGQTTIVVFSSTEWNPSRVEQMTLFYNALARAATLGTGTTALPADRLRSLSADGAGYCLHFSGAAESVPFLVSPTLDCHSETARAFGVYGQQAVFVVDDTGTVRFRQVVQGAMPDTRVIVDALRDLQCPRSQNATSGWRATRRDFVASVFAGAVSLMFAASAQADATPGPAVEQPPRPAPRAVPGTMPITLRVNGQAHELQLDPRVTLLDALREHIGLTGSKKGCDHGQCGACTVHIDGDRALSCIALAAQVQGAEVVTIEGLAQGDTLHPMQEAFIAHDGYQCGYCTPGQIMSAVALLKEGRATTEAELREGMSGNLCRCAAYPHILASVKAARDMSRA